jgi:bifunctional UDP-N-acetylglucosamine pyrophosphorylase / glucosamine-1-phosphate N-acetyltransferase
MSYSAAQQALTIVILAAGKGSRLKSDLPKVLHPLYGKPLLGWVINAAKALKPQSLTVVVGHGREKVASYLKTVAQPSCPCPIESVVQDPPLGTGHALMQVPPQSWATGTLMVLAGDVPLITAETLAQLFQAHQAQQADLTVLTAVVTNPTGYGRVLCDAHGCPQTIVEEKDATPDQKRIQTVNTGMFCFKGATIAPLLNHLSNQNAQGEYYLTDLVDLAQAAGLKTASVSLANPAEMTGVNTRAQLAECHEHMRQTTLAHWQDNGVTILDPAQTWISPEATIGPDTTVYPGCVIEGPVTIGRGVTVGPHTVIRGKSTIGDRSWVCQSHLINSHVGEDGLIGPFAHLRDGAAVAHNVKVGNFVELKNATVGPDSFVSHLAYVGDATLGQDVNWGAGSITANYNHLTKVKARTDVADHASVGSNCVLVAPVSVGKQAVVAAGSVITKPVAAGALALARAKQTEIPGWAAQKLAASTQAGEP